MAAARCVNGPHGRPGPRQPVPQPGAEASNPGHGPPGPGAHGSIHPPPPHLHQARPYFYMQPPPMPPLMHYQWPMPIPFNPYSGFPGMGYSMVMPQFPPAFMEPPSYVLPHAQLLPADYRRVLQPPYPQAAAHYQNLNQNPNMRFYHQQNQGCIPRETVSSEVQTDPMFPDVRKASPVYGNKNPLAGSDSGRGTGSSAHSSPGSEGKVGSCFEEERNSISSSTSKALYVNKGRSQGGGTPTKRQKSQSRRISIEALARVGAELGHFDMSSVCSSDSMVPVCSSSNRDDDIIEGRRVSFPDILKGGLGSPAVTKTPDVPRCDHKESQEEEEKENRDLTPEEKEDRDSPEDCDLTPELNEDCDLFPEEKEDHDSPEDCDLTPELNEDYDLTPEEKADHDSPEDCDFTPELNEDCDLPLENNSHSKMLTLPLEVCEYILVPRKVNESAWSVETLAPYIPTTEWLIQNGLLDPANVPQKVPEMSGNDTSPQQKSFAYVQMKKTANESVWSVDSLPPYVPSADWVIQNDSQNYANAVKEMGSDVANNSQAQLLKRIMAAKESRQKLLFSESSVDSLPSYVPSASWLADQGNVYYCSKMLLPSQQDVDVFLNPSDELSLYRRPNMESELGHSEQEKEAGNPKKCLNFEFLEKDGVGNSQTLPSTIPNIEKDLEGCMEHEAHCSPNPRTLGVARNRCPPEHLKPTISIHVEVEGDLGNQEMEIDQEMDKDVPKEPSQQILEKMVMGALTSMSIPTYLASGHLKKFSCEEKSKQHACACRKSPLHTGSDEDRPKQHACAGRKSPQHTGSDEDRTKQHAGAYRKSPRHTGSDEDRPEQHAGAYRKSPRYTGSDENAGNIPPDASKRQIKRRGNGFQWKPERVRGANKPRADREMNDKVHGPKNKKYGPWKNRPLHDSSQVQTNPTNKPFNQRTGQRNRQERPVMVPMSENQEEEMEGTH